MSKLNDSTLKIFKKYRLDTNMSVFGNENKLYDVVKVMDDMVGNQVGKYIGNVGYLSSTQTQNANFVNANAGKSVDVQKDDFISSRRYSDNVIYFNPFTFKYLGSVPANSSVVPIATIIDENLNSICYVGINLTLGAFSTYSDLLCLNKIEVNFEDKKSYGFMTLLFFTNSNTIFYSATSCYLLDIMSNKGSSIAIPNKPKYVSSPIVLPKEIDELDLTRPIFYSGGSIKQNITLTDLNVGQLYILEV